MSTRAYPYSLPPAPGSVTVSFPLPLRDYPPAPGPGATVPFRTPALSPAALPRFASAGLNPDLTATYTSLVQATLAHPNSAPGPLIPRVESMR